MDEWFALFASSVWRYLDGLAGSEAQGRAPSKSDVRKLVAAWRALLRLHESGSARGCPGCERDPHACTVWQVAIGYFVRRPNDKRRDG